MENQFINKNKLNLWSFFIAIFAEEGDKQSLDCVSLKRHSFRFKILNCDVPLS